MTVPEQHRSGMKISAFTPTYSIAIERTELTAPLIDGLISFDNFEPQWIQEPIGRGFDKAFHRGDYDICELSLARCIMAHSCNTLFHQLLYIFPNRRFRHDVIYVDARSEEQTSELQSHMRISYADLCW